MRWTKTILYCTRGTCLYLTETTRKLNRDRFYTFSIPQYVVKKVQLWARVMGTLRDNEFITQLTSRTERQIKRDMTMLERSQNCPIYRESQLAIGWDEEFCTRYDEISTEDHTFVCTAEEHRRREISWVLVLNSQGTLRRSHQNQRAIVRRVWRSKAVWEPSELTRKPECKGTLLLPHQARLRHCGNHRTIGGRHRVGMNSELLFFTNCKVFRLQAMAIPL